MYSVMGSNYNIPQSLIEDLKYVFKDYGWQPIAYVDFKEDKGVLLVRSLSETYLVPVELDYFKGIWRLAGSAVTTEEFMNGIRRMFQAIYNFLVGLSRSYLENLRLNGD